MSKFNVGDKVKYIGIEHDINPQWFPIVGTIGTVIQDVDEIDCYIQWSKGSTSKEDRWYCNKNDIELVENEDMTNEEIWEMLESKMRKNGLISKANLVYISADNYPNNKVKITKTYLEDDVHNAIALAYKVGYLRSQKGRPFKIGEKTEEKKKGGHWEPVDLNNLPKEGTKVRYSRESEEYSSQKKPIIALGDIGEFSYGNTIGLPGICFHDGRFWDWVSFSNEIDCLDMWVEDDE